MRVAWWDRCKKWTKISLYSLLWHCRFDVRRKSRIANKLALPRRGTF
jgi:hypothetical protein